MKKIVVIVGLFTGIYGFSQDLENNDNQSNIKTYTPSKLLKNKQWDIKWFNNLFTQTKAANNTGDVTKNLPRQSYFTTSFEAFYGASTAGKFNVGLLGEIRSNTIQNKAALSVFKFENVSGVSRAGLSSLAPAIKFNPISYVPNFTLQSAFHIPLIKEETNSSGVFLDQTAYTFQNRLFYDYTLPSGNWQWFTELNTEYHFGNANSFANNTYVLAPGMFVSYFPNEKFTVLGFIQHQQRFGDFSQNYTAIGAGLKYQITQMLNLETLYSNFVRGQDTGLGQSFNVGLRALF